MFHLAQSSNRFDIYYQQTLVFAHRNDDPSLILGIGIPKVKEDEGYYTLKEKITQSIAMDRFSVKLNTESKIEIQFSNSRTYQNAMVQFIAGDELTITIETEIVDINRCWFHLPSHPEENVYGCGEQFSYFCLNDKKVPLWVQESGVGRSGIKQKLAELIAHKGGSPFHTYFPQPTFVGFASNVNYYCDIDTSAYGHIEFHKKGKKNPYHELYFWDVPAKIQLRYESSPMNVVSQLSEKLGRQPSLPEWVYDGIWVAIQGHGGLDVVRDRLAKFLDAGVKIGAIWSQDWEGIRTTPVGTRLFWDWKWNGQGRPIRFPDFPSFVKEMRDKGIRYLGYINCFLSLPGDLYHEVPDKKYFVQTSYDTEYRMDISENEVVMLDLTNPDCFTWLKSVIKKYMIQEAGLSGWMSDYCEYLPLDAKLDSEEDPALIHNLYPVLFAKANYEAIQELGLEKEVTFFSRAGYKGTSRYAPNIWAGDQLVSWDRHDGIGSVIPAALSSGVSGIGHHHSDIGGYTTVAWVKRTKEVLLRWTELATFTIIMRSHEGLRPEENWQLDSDEETLTHLARMSRIHVALKPYLMHCEEEYQTKGIPIQRAPVLHYPHDRKTALMDDQYLLGDDLWVVPVLKEGVTQMNVYLPDDDWIHLWSGVAFNKGVIKVDVPLGYPAVFYRKSSKFVSLFAQITEEFGLRSQ